MKIAVTGSAGFIGTHLVPALLAEGYRVAAIDQPGAGAQTDGVESFSADIAAGEGLSAGFAGADAVVHLAARNHLLKETARDPQAAYRRVNVEGTRNVMRAAAGSGARWFVHISSVKAVGEESEKILDEESPCSPKTPYGISKLESEDVVRTEVAGSGMGAVILRLPMVYGPGNKGNLPRMIRWAKRGFPFPLFQPENLRSMAYVENVVAGILAALRGPSMGTRTFFLKDREDCSTRLLYSAICRELGKPPRFLPVPAALVRVGGALSEDFRKVTGSLRVSSRKLEKDLGFLPPVSFDEGIARTVRWCRESVR